MNYIFWICWIGEIGVVGWWMLDEMKLKYLQPNPYAFLGFLYLLVTLGVRYGLKLPGVSTAMVAVPAVPLLFLLLIIVVSMLTGGKWN